MRDLFLLQYLVQEPAYSHLTVQFFIYTILHLTPSIKHQSISPFSSRAQTQIPSRTAQPTMADQPLDTWSCCKCHSSNVIALTTQCPIFPCKHNMCNSCRRGPPSPTLGCAAPLFPTSPPPQYSYSSSRYPSYVATGATSEYSIPRPLQPMQPSAPPRQYGLGAAVPSSLAARPQRGMSSNPYGGGGGGGGSGYGSGYGSVYGRGTGRNPYSPHMSLGRPDMSGWWKCCQDGWLNNPALVGNVCSRDRHQKCDWCEKY